MCTRLILSGQPISVIQRIMGDNTPDIIMKIYTHVNSEDLADAAQMNPLAKKKKRKLPPSDPPEEM